MEPVHIYEGMSKVKLPVGRYLVEKRSTGKVNLAYELANDICVATNTKSVKRWLKLTYKNYSAAQRALVAIKEITGIRNKGAYLTKMFSLYSNS